MGVVTISIVALKMTGLSNIKIEYIFDWTSLALVLGGTFLALILNFPFKLIIQSFSAIKVLLSKDKYSIEDTINAFDKLSEQARKKGILSLESEINALDNTFFKKGIMLLVDGHSKEKVSYILENDIEQMNIRHEQIITLYDKVAGYATASGLLGTLIQVILTLRQITMVGDGINTMMIQMAIALLPTLYGGILAYLWYIPIVNKLIAKHEKEVLYKNLIRDGVMAIQLGNSPKQVREQLFSYVSERKRVHH